MSCNGCRVLRKGCSEDCVLRSCLQWIESPEAQGYATVFVAKFFGRAALMSFVSAVPQDQRPALFESLLYEAAGRTVNPVNGAVGLLSTGNWHVCQEAVKAVLAGASPVNKENSSSDQDQSKKRRRCVSDHGGQHHPSPTTANSSISKLADLDLSLTPRGSKASHLVREKRRLGSPSMNNSEESVTTTCGYQFQQQADEIKLLNLFN